MDSETSKLVQCIGSTDDYPKNRCVHELVHAQASDNPEMLALSSGCISVSYGELEVRSNKLAHYLQSLGVGPEIVVGLCMFRSVDQIIGALAILKAGGAYLPVDPANPSQRISFMLEDAQVSILLTEERLSKRFSSHKWRNVSIDGSDRHNIEEQPSRATVPNANGEHLAYVIYTSGSTGVPKGTAVTHGNLLNLVYWHQKTFHITAEDRATYFAGLGFDASVWELWPYLTAGASLHLPEESVRTAPEGLRDWLVAQGVTISFAPTPLAERLITLPWPSNTALRTLLTGGDTLHRFPPAHLPFTVVNNYGPTECTVVASSGVVGTKEEQPGLPTIGRPIANTRIHILDGDFKPVSQGDLGEIFISGPSVARGYLHHPEVTTEKFLANPFDPTPGSRLYRTGDLARLLENGEIAFVGRVDDQIKIRGFRIEPDEITAHINEHPSVQQSVVVARVLGEGGKGLVAYIILAPGSDTSQSELKSFLYNRLPDYMVPATFVRLDSLPLTPSGKVDRTALPAPVADNMLRDEDFVAPRTPIEERVAEILAPLLGVEKVSVEDNFFMLGGHSLLGTQLIARMRDAFGVNLSLRSIFDAPTVADLAAQIETTLVAQLEAMSEEEAENALSQNDRLFEKA